MGLRISFSGETQFLLEIHSALVLVEMSKHRHLEYHTIYSHLFRTEMSIIRGKKLPYGTMFF